MQISWNWLSEWIDLSAVGGPKGLGELLTRRGLEVESIHSLAEGFDKVVTVRILERNPHPQADRLSICKVTTGMGEPMEIVCGAQNMKAGDTVALAQIGAHLPNGLKITASKIRGVVSNGMLCSEEELRLKDASEGILILPPETPLGKPLAEILGQDDTILTFKLTANRADCLSHFGFAREIAAALGQKPKRREPPALPKGNSPIRIQLNAGESGPQFWGAYIEGVKVGPSPAWVVKRLESLGLRSINNVVDATNYLMLELGQPVHAYDADLIEGRLIEVRRAKAGESLPLLDGKTVELAGSELVIADGKRAVGLAGVMGGGNSEVRPETTRVFLECAEFEPVLVRRASSLHQRKTDASHRFERGVDPMGQAHAIARLAQLVTEWADGKVTGSDSVVLPSRDPSKGFKRRTVQVPKDYFSQFLGMELPNVERVLESEYCEVAQSGSDWLVTVPTHRLDLAIKQDLAEEVARTVGYDAIPATIPPVTTAPLTSLGGQAAAEFDLLLKAKEALAGAGLNETMNYAFTSRAWLEKFGLSSTVPVKNPLSAEHEVMVPSLIPGLVQNALHSWHRHFGSEALAIRLFEIRPTFHAEGEIAAKGETESNVREVWKVAVALSGPRFVTGMRNELGEIDYADGKAVLERFFEQLGARGVRLGVPSGRAEPAQSRIQHLLHPGKTVEILAGKGAVGAFGLVHPGVAKDLKLRAQLWIGEFEWEPIAKLARPARAPVVFKPWSEFPGIERDFALVVGGDFTAEKITQVAIKAGKPLAKTVKVFDIYRGSQVAEGMTSVAVRVIFSEEGRSLQESEADAASQAILKAWEKEIGAQLRS